MKNALDSFLKGGAGDVGTAAPSYESDFNLAEPDAEDAAQGSAVLDEINSLLPQASEDQLMQIKGILMAPKEGDEEMATGATGTSGASSSTKDMGEM